MRFLHTTDLHLLDLQGVRAWNYFNKRITGRLNLALNRGRKHSDVLFDAVASQLEALAVDRLVVTGDLTNLSLESEFALCSRKFEALGVPITVVPGNHDAYTPGCVRSGLFERYLRAHMEGERNPDCPYPFLWRGDGVAILGVSTAVATAPFVATGRIGPEQLETLGRMLDQAGREGRTRIVLLHHPPTPGVSKLRHDLLDLAAFGEVIARHGAELVLHGHEHRSLDTALAGPAGAVPVHGIASTTSLSTREGRRASFSVYDVGKGGIARERYEWNGDTFERASTGC